MKNYLLIGAGFSRNWGGWLASEVFEYLLGSPEFIENPELRELLWKHQRQGGFEGALAELQYNYIIDPKFNRISLIKFETAVKHMFVEMNKSLMAHSNWNFGQQTRSRQIGTFLTRFDAIFTLNQDLLLEHFYVNSYFEAGGPSRWNGSELPSMQRIPPQQAFYADSWAHSTWVPNDTDAYKPSVDFQPIYKLHGSSNWTRADGAPLLIMGGAKMREIDQSPILNQYAKDFESSLVTDSARLMVIGYGFRDQHINTAIERGVEQGLKLFIIAPDGAELAQQLNPTRAPGQIMAPTPLEEMFKRSVLGASRRSLREIFHSDEVEYAKVLRFFER
ncbi:SIR2 family protein [Phenylobacterium sp.]|uniref:SIR2 family protein n=1 Tax=Phenylobacterium sp. TaxID=1871053 RepID=UPI0025F62D4C|nr:SIR2 family protein [Phenylobacterium sp.]MCA3714283.1 SIR2 family protein [Phenylobacterium sp.]